MATIIHLAFILSAIGLAWIDQMSARTQAITAAAHHGPAGNAPDR